MDLALVRKHRLGHMFSHGSPTKFEFDNWHVEKCAQVNLLLEMFRRKAWSKECSVDKETGMCTACSIFLAIGFRKVYQSVFYEDVMGCAFSHHGIAKLRKCEQNGCLLCGLLWKSYMAARSTDQTPTEVWLTVDTYRTTRVEIAVRWGDGSFADLLFDQNSPLAEDDNAKPSVRSPKVRDRKFRGKPSQPSYSGVTALQWLRKCCESHQRCQISEYDSSWLPSRLIDLEDLLETGQVRLRQRSEVLGSASCAYATLSHCWGNRTPESSDCLHERTESQLYGGRGIKTFCILFQEAMSFTKSLGLRYLWIDCLCIFQGRSNEWYSESAQMLNVYGNSTVNLAASSSVSGQSPLMPHKFTNSPLVIEELGSRGTRIPFRYTSSRYEYAMFMNQPLHSRGWVLQELYLSRRVIYFTESQVYWRCREFQASEHQPDGGQFDFLLNNDLDMYVSRSQELEERQKQHYLETKWQGLVGNYSRTALSYASDRLDAFSGIAKRFSAEYQSLGIQAKYAAGIWCHELAQGLSWFAYTPASRASEYIAPSWSWASMDPFDYWWGHVGENDTQVAIIDVSLTPVAPSNEYGRISDGYLLVECSVYRPPESLVLQTDGNAVTVSPGVVVKLEIRFDEKRHCGTVLDPSVCFLLCNANRGRESLCVGGIMLSPASAAECLDKPGKTLYVRRGYWIIIPTGAWDVEAREPWWLKFCELFRFNPDSPEESYKERFMIV